MPLDIPPAGTKEWFEFFKANQAAFAETPADVFTKDGLVQCTELLQISERGYFTFWLKRHENVCVVPGFHVRDVTQYLLPRESILRSAAIRVSPNLPCEFGAPLFGVPFAKAVELAIAGKYVKAEFYLPNDDTGGFNTRLLLHVNRRKESNGSVIQLQAWQYNVELPDVYYIHAESKDFSESVSHFDGALIQMSPEQIEALFTQCDKIKGDSYEKQFRLDGEIPLTDFYNLARHFFPVEELVDEAFELGEYAT